MLRDTVDKLAFEKAKLKVLTGQHDPHGFGTLQEKTVHALMKQYYVDNEDYHEVPINGYIADIYTGNEIIEIQNGNFRHMRDKLASFLPEYDVCLVYPFPRKKWLCWINPDTGELIEKRKSPLTCSVYDALPEFFKIKDYLTDPHLHIRIPLLDIEEYRLLDGSRTKRSKKIGSHRYDRVPLDIVEEIIIDSLKDYIQLFPMDLPENFSVKDLAASCKISASLAQEACKLCFDIGVLSRYKEGRSFLYSINYE